jgi:hypothetical protein
MLGDQRKSAQARQDDRNVLQVQLDVDVFDEARTHHGGQADQEQNAAHHQGKEARTRATELAERVTQRRHAEEQRDRDDEQASEKISVIHIKSGQVDGNAGHRRYEEQSRKGFVAA